MPSFDDNQRLEDLLRVLYPDRPPRVPPRFWSPPPDPERPVLPYMPGFKNQIKSHVAPPPFGDARPYDVWPRKQLSNTELQSMTQSALVVSNPPLEARTANPDTDIPPETAELTITS